MRAKRTFVAMTAVRFGAWPFGVRLNKQVDTASTEFPVSFTENKIMHFAQAARIVRRLRQAPKRNTPLSWMPGFVGTTARSLRETPWQLSALRVHLIIHGRRHATLRWLTAARCQDRVR
jgi:hypothetical protein